MVTQNKNTLMLVAAGAGALLATRAALKRWRIYDLRGKTVLITGGSRGLGLELARVFASEGAQVVICARDTAELERAQADLKTHSGRVFTISCDVTARKQVNDMVGLVHQECGPIDVLVNNAGLIQVGPMELMELEDYEEAMKLHFWAPLYTTLAVLPHMRERRDGRIVNIASIGGKLSVPHLLPYTASKFALVGLSEGLHAELAKDGIVVTTVCPGLMRTGSHLNAQFKGQHYAEYAWFSVGGALPPASMNAERAAHQIVAACKRGDASVVLSLPAQLADIFHALFPDLTADLLSMVNQLLPAVGGIGTDQAKGKESRSMLSPSWLTTLSDQAAERNNELA